MRRSIPKGLSPLLRVPAAVLLLLSLGGGPAKAMVEVPDLLALEVALPPAPPVEARDLRLRDHGAADLARRTGSLWQGWWDDRRGSAGLLMPQHLGLARSTDDAPAIDSRIREFLRTNAEIFTASVDELRTCRLALHGGVWWATYEQQLDGMPVLGARLDLRLNEKGDLLLVQNRTIRGLVSPGPGLSAAEAEAIAAADLQARGLIVAGLAPVIAGIDECGMTEEVIVPVWNGPAGRYDAHRAYRVRQELFEPHRARFRTYVDTSDGRLLSRTNEIAYLQAEGTARGDQQPLTPTDPYTRSLLDDLRVTVSGAGSSYTDAAGHFILSVPDALPHPAAAGLDGRYCNVNRQDGSDAQATGSAQAGLPLSLVFQDGNSVAAERDVFYHANRAHDAIRVIDPSFTGVDYEMPAAVNISQTCNAYWDGTGINFYKDGGGCANTGQIADVIYHEYGHGVSQYAYAPGSPSGAMGEGFSDYFAATITNQSKIGLGFSGPGTWLRDCDNTRTWPAAECGGEAHCLGEVIAGALWDMRGNLIAALGDQAAGVALSDHLFHFARFGGNNDFEGYYYDLLSVDDDNGTLVDGTPHAPSIIEAFSLHNIGPGFVLQILHEPLADTDQPYAPITVRALFSSAVPLQIDSLAVYYSTQPIGGGAVTGPRRLQMSATGGIREYAAQIPGQPLGTRVLYYLSGATSELGLAALEPATAPADQHEFLIAADLTAPSVLHEAKTERSRHVWPVPIVATVTDNQAVQSVSLEYRIDGADRPSVALASQGGHLYGGFFGGSVGVGDVVEYRIKATDTAVVPNVSYLPSTGFFSMPIVRDLTHDAEDGAQDMEHRAGTAGMVDQWHLSTARDHTSGTGHSWKCGDAAGGSYADGSDGVLELLPVSLGTGASLTFWHWIAAEDGGSGTAWDGGLVEISTDGGSTWSPLQPAGGYTHTIIENPASPFPAGYPVWSGSFGWRQAVIDLSAYAGDLVRVRFRFGSDGYVAYEGWYIDDILLVPTTNEAAGLDTSDLPPLSTGLLGIAPNPARDETAIRYAIAAGDRTVSLTIHDLTGRRIRTLLDGLAEPGRQTAIWDGRDDRGKRAPAGVYFARIRWRSGDDSLKLLLIE